MSCWTQLRAALKQIRAPRAPTQIHYNVRFFSFCAFNFVQVEMLYQRYFLRMNQSNTTHILSLLLALVLSLAAVQIILIPMESATSQSHRNTLQRNRYNDEVNSNGSNLSPSLNRTHNNNTNYTLNANSQQNFVRLNYNYSTDNETGNWLFCAISNFMALLLFVADEQLWCLTWCQQQQQQQHHI